MLKQPKRHATDTLFTFLLLLSFCLFTMVLSGMGAAVYKNSSAHLEENYTSRTAVAYVTEKVRQHNTAGSIFLSEVEGIPALALRDTIENSDFLTYVYFYENHLCELMTRAENTPTAQMGTPLVELSSLDIRLADHSQDSSLLRVTAVSPEGNTLSAILHCY